MGNQINGRSSPLPLDCAAMQDGLNSSINIAPLDQRKQNSAQRPDSLVTQVYNYLDLGSPVVAWNFDEELSSISGIPVQQLRKDDCISTSLGRPPYQGSGTAQAQKSPRWQALKLYIQAWDALQEQNNTSTPLE
ncbi:uncharacterized protein B0I36DRAFT_369987 [Microdochium trichocladiopsis]|uniref:Uncharacterized protein n=1 Tax=Microdochium trichocladiopsis TaxID=1682393 RepID=A0A9P8XQY2_9PEZI|nr:uncharacterized protein B0I36DRAFT_370529 [Microdochium trichocladiopsis]XP_046004583.1 uncharacterized protein B0I36DRAFT_369987 [Microdochium trichocladiopsis]KAH7009117.1 hypothetical protein B0I36DRAFT_370529 [Microdochium trichocladiopsis]KAH7012207.1 hypothetical protein B0I36DRAFT_369987 [Microdochium trichocladiopsis]